MFRIITLLIILGSTTIARTQTSLPAFFNDNMVLQQQEMVSVWGKDVPGTNINISGSWGNSASTIAEKDGKWRIKIQTPKAGGPYSVKIIGTKEITLNNVLIGEVWLCSGQSNMQMPIKGMSNQPVYGSNEEILNSENDQIRLFHTKKRSSPEPLYDVKGEWFETNPYTVPNFSATAYFFGKKLQSILKVPIGLIHTSWGGTPAEAWTDMETLLQLKNIKIPQKLSNDKPKQPSKLYNAMIHPYIGYNIKGFIWYQGESNRTRAEQYKTLFPAMIKSWRDKWQIEDIPFYFVQIAPFSYKSDKGNNYSPFLREAQLHTMQTVENTGMVVTLDIGDCDCIHPGEKMTVGNRLAYWALAKTYDIKGIAYSGPVYKEMNILENGEVELFFDFIKMGFSTFGRELSGFEIAGSDKVFYPAQAKINKNKSITVWSDKVAKPAAVRYAFDNCIEGTLFNTEGLPASPFRTDDWDN